MVLFKCHNFYCGETQLKTINDYAPSTYDFVLLDPLGEPTEGRMTIVGRYSTEFYNAARDTLRDKNIFDQSLKVLEDENTNTLAACVKDWNEDFFLEPCTQENVIRLLSNPKMHWIKEQLEVIVLDKARFFRKSDKSGD